MRYIEEKRVGQGYLSATIMTDNYIYEVSGADLYLVCGRCIELLNVNEVIFHEVRTNSRRIVRDHPSDRRMYTYPEFIDHVSDDILISSLFDLYSGKSQIKVIPRDRSKKTENIFDYLIRLWTTGRNVAPNF